MAAYGDLNRFPKEVRVSQSAIPGAGSAGDVTTLDTDLSYIAVTNTTGSTINLKLMNAQSAVIGNFSGYPIAIGTSPYVIQFEPQLRFEGGMKWLATSAGLVADVFGHSRVAYSVPPQS